MRNDAHFLQMALDLAEQGKHSCQPNPMVGCVITLGAEVIGKGFHMQAGQAHAEINALADVKKNNVSAKGATVYVSLEPCSHQGRTPPCAESLIEAKVARVVIAMLDPNPLVSGKGIRLLQKAGIQIDVIGNTELRERAEYLNRAFLYKMRTGKPYVILKIATTLDGRTADHLGESQWITGAAARNDVQELRASSCAVLTGSGTQLADNPSLNVRIAEVSRQPYRILLDTSNQLDRQAKIIGDDKRLILFSSKGGIETQLQARLLAHHQVDKVGDRLDLSEVMHELAKYDINQLMVEAGATLAGAFIEQDLVQEIVHYLAPSVLGDKARSALWFSEAKKLNDKLNYSIVSSGKVGDDLKVVYKKRK